MRRVCDPPLAVVQLSRLPHVTEKSPNGNLKNSGYTDAGVVAQTLMLVQNGASEVANRISGKYAGSDDPSQVRPVFDRTCRHGCLSGRFSALALNHSSHQRPGLSVCAVRRLRSRVSPKVKRTHAQSPNPQLQPEELGIYVVPSTLILFIALNLRSSVHDYSRSKDQGATGGCAGRSAN
jgi:hypothetical protein